MYGSTLFNNIKSFTAVVANIMKIPQQSFRRPSRWLVAEGIKQPDTLDLDEACVDEFKLVVLYGHNTGIFSLWKPSQIARGTSMDNVE